MLLFITVFGPLTLIGECPLHKLDRFLEKLSNRRYENFGTADRPISPKNENFEDTKIDQILSDEPG